MKKILYATDGSDSAMEAAAMVNELMKAWPTAKLDVIYVTQIFSSGMGAAVPMNFGTELADDVGARSLAALHETSDRVSFRHVKDLASPAVVLSTIAQVEGFDLIVVGSHGRGAVDRLLLGSVSHGLVNRSSVPILVVR